MFHRVLIWALCLCVFATFAAQVVAQALPEQTTPQTPSTAPDMTGWNRVGELRDGRRIIVSVGSGFPIHCIFRSTTDHSVLCDEGSLFRGIDHREIARDQVAWLRTDNTPATGLYGRALPGAQALFLARWWLPPAHSGSWARFSAGRSAWASEPSPPFRWRFPCLARRSTCSPDLPLPIIPHTFAGLFSRSELHNQSNPRRCNRGEAIGPLEETRGRRQLGERSNFIRAGRSWLR